MNGLAGIIPAFSAERKTILPTGLRAADRCAELISSRFQGLDDSQRSRRGQLEMPEFGIELLGAKSEANDHVGLRQRDHAINITTRISH